MFGRRITVILLVIAAMIYTFVFVYPEFFPVLLGPSKHKLDGLIDVILTPAKSGIGQYYLWVLLGVMITMVLIVSYDLKHRPSGTYGTARIANRSDARKYYTPLTIPRIPTLRLKLPMLQLPRSSEPTQSTAQTKALDRLVRPPSPGSQRLKVMATRKDGHRLYLGTYQGRAISLSEQQQYEHLLMTAPSGKGKSTRFIIPNLLREDGSRSLFVADLKNELYEICAGWLSRHMQVWLFAPTKPHLSAGYNPLAHIHSVEDAQDFAETWVANTSSKMQVGDSKFWDTNSALLISAIVLHLIETEPDPPFSRLADVLATLSFEELRKLLNTTRSRDARYIARQFLENMKDNERLVGSQMTDTSNRFQLLASHNARAVTATNDIDFEKMVETPTAFFLSIPRKATRRYRPLLAVLTQQMFAAWEERRTKGIACYLDEFTNLGYIPGYAEFVSTARALNVSLIMAIQDFAQLDERYGPNDAKTIKANAETHLVLTGTGLDECEYYSKRIGDTTVKTTTINKRGSGMSTEITSSESETRRRLMTPEEIRTMDRDTMLMLGSSTPPLLLITKMYYLDPWYLERAELPIPGVPKITEEPAPPPAARQPGLPAADTQDPPRVVDGDIDKSDDEESNDSYSSPE